MLLPLIAWTLVAQSPAQADLQALHSLLQYAPTRSAPTDEAVQQAETRLLNRVWNLQALSEEVRKELDAALEQNRDRATPMPSKPIRANDPLARVLCAYENAKTLALPVDQVRKFRTADAFPGSIPEGTPRVTRSLSLDVAIPGRRFLEGYAAPGEVVVVRLSGSVPPGTRVRIGAHSDNIQGRDSWPRPPSISKVFDAKEGENRVANPFGGLLYLEIPQGHNGRLQVVVENVVTAPYYIHGKTTKGEWQLERQAPAPWAELETSKLILTVPSSVIRDLDDPVALMKFWDDVMDACADLATIPHERLRAERMVADVQISAGYMHAGYPIMVPTGEAKNMVDLNHLRNGTWGFFHEIGHNHQNPDWTFSGTGEVTVNLFSLYVNEKICGKKWNEVWGEGFHKSPERVKELLAEGKKPWDTGDLALRLYMYVQLKEAFGWEAFQKVFAEYRALPQSERPKNDDEKRDQWLIRLSRTVGRNLGPFFERWGVPTSSTARDSLRDLPVWLPEGWK
ncbi:MAG: hypothetical protein KatS3mg015_1216 [Fimbriimonadales bacterium]|nr:MAG: hypothetical protein KatS3mg015_1216 [Fimbriimonadales bacterium]